MTNGYDLKSHGSVFLFRRQNTNAPANAQSPHNQFVYVAKLSSADSSYLEHQRNHFGTCYISFLYLVLQFIDKLTFLNKGRMLHFADRMLYVGAGRSLLDKVYAFTYADGTSFNLDKIYLTDKGQWFVNTGFANQAANPTAMISTQAGCSTGKCDDARDLHRPTFYGAFAQNVGVLFAHLKSAGLPFCSDGETAVVGNVNIDKTGTAFITSKDLVTIFHTPICMTFSTPWQWEYDFPNAG